MAMQVLFLLIIFLFCDAAAQYSSRTGGNACTNGVNSATSCSAGEECKAVASGSSSVTLAAINAGDTTWTVTSISNGATLAVGMYMRIPAVTGTKYTVIATSTDAPLTGAGSVTMDTGLTTAQAGATLAFSYDGLCTSCQPGFYSTIGVDSCAAVTLGYEPVDSNSCNAWALVVAPAVACGSTSVGAVGQRSCGSGYTSAPVTNNGVTTITCTKCAAGKYQTCTSANPQVCTCTSCPLGNYQGNQGSTLCLDVGVGYFPVDGSGAAVTGATLGAQGQADCGSGAGTVGVGQTSTGYISGLTAQVACTACPAGKYNDHTTASACKTCPTGTYAIAPASITGSGAIACTNCPAGYSTGTISQGNVYTTATFLDQTSQSSCYKCNAGYYVSKSAGGASQTCTACPKDTYSQVLGMTSATVNPFSAGCTPCTVLGSKYTSPPASALLSQCTETCQAGYFGTPGACSLCPSGTYAIGASASRTSCVSVSAGYYPVDVDGLGVTLTGAVNQNQCPAGTFSPGSLAADGTTNTCAKCPSVASTSTSYYAGTGASVCTTTSVGNIPNNVNGYPTGQSQCAAGKYAGPGDTTCSNCAVGYYSTAAASACTPVPSATYPVIFVSALLSVPATTANIAQYVIGADRYSPCPPGTYSTGGVDLAAANFGQTGTCVDCPAGKYASSTAGSSSCTPVSPGFQQTKNGAYNAGTGSTGQSACDPGYAPLTPIYYDFTVNSGVLLQTTGKTLQIPVTSTTGITVGSTVYSTDNVPQIPSTANGAVTFIGTSSITLTFATSTTLGPFSNIPLKVTTKTATIGSASQCTAIAAGHYAAAADGITPVTTSGAAQSVPCPAGYYSTSANSASGQYCKSCPAGKIGPSAGATLLLATNLQTPNGCIDVSTIGKYSGPGASAESTCADGSTSASPFTSCTFCPPGKAGTSGTCTDCIAGMYAVYTGSTECLACPGGTFSSSSGVTTCTSCSAGTFAWNKLTGNVGCTDCEPGTYSSATGVESCTTCPAGTWADNTKFGATSSSICSACPAGYTSSEKTTGTSATAACTKCSAGTFSSASSSPTCSYCALGKYASSTGSTSCTSVPAGSYAYVAKGAAIASCTGSACIFQTSLISLGSGAYAWIYKPHGGTEKYYSYSTLAVTGYVDNTKTVTLSTAPTWAQNDEVTFVGGLGNNAVEFCPAGYFSSAGNIGSCTAVSPGYYPVDILGQQTGAVYTVAPGSTGGTTGSVSQKPCPAGYFVSSAGAACTIVPAYSYPVDANGNLATIAAVSSSLCPAGTNGTAATGNSGACSLCAAGTSSIQGTGSCFPCAAGFYSATAGSTCTICSPGSYSTSTGSTSCTKTSPGYYPVDDSGSVVTLASVGAVDQKNCPKGTSSVGGIAGVAASCPPCAGGAYSSSIGASSCTTVSAGYYPVDGSATPVPVTAATMLAFGQLPCPKGTYSTGGALAVATGSGAPCTACSAGAYSSSTGASSCTAVSPGQYPVDVSATPVTAATTLAVGQLPCPVGTYSPGGALAVATVCTACSAGAYSSSTGASSCTAVSPGQYPVDGSVPPVPVTAATTLAVGQLPCPKGTYSTGGALADATNVCTACPAGKYSSSTGSSSCTAVSAGFYPIDGSIPPVPVTGTSAVGQQACPAGTYSPGGIAADATKKCKQVSAGYFPVISGSLNTGTGSTDQIICEVGSYSALGNAAACTPVPAGSYAMMLSSNPALGAAGAASMQACASGKYSTLANSRANLPCVTCPDGTYQVLTDQTTAGYCTPCPAGKYQTGSPQTSCADVMAGEYAVTVLGVSNTGTGSVGKQNCLVGTYSTAATALSGSPCTICPAGRYGDSITVPGVTTGATSNSHCLTCAASNSLSTTTSGLSPASSCSLASAGYYVAYQGAAQTPCPPGTRSSAGASSCIACEPGFWAPSATATVTTTTTVSSVTIQGSLTTGSASVTITSYTGVSIGQTVTGTGIPAGTTVVGVTQSALTLSAPATATNPATTLTFTQTSSSLSCIPASPGYYVSTTSASSQTPCPAGTFSSSSAQVTCSTAPAGFVPALGGAAASSAATGITICPSGTYSATAGSTACSGCPSASSPGLTYCPSAASSASSASSQTPSSLTSVASADTSVNSATLAFALFSFTGLAIFGAVRVYRSWGIEPSPTAPPYRQLATRDLQDDFGEGLVSPRRERA